MTTALLSHCPCSAFSQSEAPAGRRWLRSSVFRQTSRAPRHGCAALATHDLFSRQELPRQRQRLQRRGVVALGSEELVKGVEAGSKVRVCKPVTVYHSPKLGKEFDLEGQEGTVMDIVQFYKEKKLSANLPYKVQFQIPQEDGAKPVKLIAHLAGTEIEAT